ncbi:proline-rich protein 33 [Ambystoma mexicanum]|uniref:proline-rich protein 33 n=1 Tax=Ambystoma mexicanum TaxID=8296 RepID=UPI0037E71F16
MLMTVTPLPAPNEAGQLHPQAPPPRLPKPGKENIRLQKVLQKAAKKKNPPPAAAQPKVFRSTLSPVSEASPDLEHWERSPPPRTPETPSFHGLSLPPRFFIKPVVHHVSSPYPQHRPFTFTVSEQRSLSECLRRTPSPRPPSPSIKPVIPPLQLQQPPKNRPTAPGSGPIPIRLVHFPLSIPQIVEPVAPANVTPTRHTPVSEATLQEVEVKDTQALRSEAESFRERSPIAESDQKMTNLNAMGNPNMSSQPETSHVGTPTLTTINTATNHALPKTIQDALLNPTTRTESHPELGHGPKTPSIQLDTLSHPSENKPLPPTSNTRLLSPNEQGKIATKKHKVETMNVNNTAPNSDTATTTEPSAVPQKKPVSSKPSISEIPKTEALLKPMEKVKPPRTKLSGWSRLKKHLVVEPEEPHFPVPEQEAPQSNEAVPEEGKKGGDAGETANSSEGKTSKPKESRANRMWDALLYQMSSSPKEEEDKRKEEKVASSESKEESAKKEEKPSFFFRCRLPLLLYRPRFDARKLREAAARPLRKITTMFDLGRLNRKAPEEEPKDFNRTASGWQLK